MVSDHHPSPQGPRPDLDRTLTPSQARVLAAIEREMSQMGRPPTFRELARGLGYAAVGTVQDHVRALIKKGFLRNEGHGARSLQVTHRSDSLSIPVLGIVPAGNPIEAITDRQGALTIPARWKGELFALKVRGESMIEAGIFDGDYVVVRKQNHAEDGEIVVAMLDGEATVKRLERSRSGARSARLMPANPEFSPIEIPPNAENPIQGKVVSVQRFYE